MMIISFSVSHFSNWAPYCLHFFSNNIWECRSRYLKNTFYVILPILSVYIYYHFNLLKYHSTSLTYYLISYCYSTYIPYMFILSHCTSSFNVKFIQWFLFTLSFKFYLFMLLNLIRYRISKVHFIPFNVKVSNVM